MRPPQNRIALGLVMFASFLAYSAIRAPVPSVNEPHYLTKAKHFWDPSWCASDFFLNSSNPHLVFYVTVGALTRWFTLEQTAVIGRILALVLLTTGWTRLLRRLLPTHRAVVWGTWTFLAITAIGNFSGEWIVGGVEAKVFAYGFDFWALACLLDRRWYRMALFAGLAVSFHPVVGLWTAAAAIFAVVGTAVWRRESPPTSPGASASGVSQGTTGKSHKSADDSKPAHCSRFNEKAGSVGATNVWRMTVPCLLALALFVVSALPGLVPALRLVVDSARGDPFAASYIQVYYRLRHHLDPMSFHPAAYAAYGMLVVLWAACVIWMACVRRSETTENQRWFHWFVAGTGLIAVCGLAVGLGPPPSTRSLYQALRMSFLKLYPFRLFDVMMPLAVVLVLIDWVEARVYAAAQRRKALLENRAPRRAWALFAALFLFSLLCPCADRNPSRLERGRLADWLEACRWISAETPDDALFFTPKKNWAFKWYAQRAEFVTFKDCPQDAEGIVEWNRRLRYLKKWGQDHYDGIYRPEALQTLHRETGITHIIAGRLGPFSIPPVYQNGSFRIYRIDNLNNTQGAK